MICFKDHIFIFDLHNTLYDEVMEYGGAMQAAIDCLMRAAQSQGQNPDRESLCRQIAQVHAKSGSDWDDDIWNQISVLQNLDDAETIKQDIITTREKTSQALTKKYAYTETLNTIRDLKQQGARLYLATEATANAAANAVHWLELDGVFDAVYSWPFARPYRKLDKTRQHFFPSLNSNNNIFLQKPHPHILAQIILDIAKEKEIITEEIEIKDIFETFIDETIDVSALITLIQGAENIKQAMETVKSIQTLIKLKYCPHKDALQHLWDKCFYIGDSFFKDGFLAHNAQMPFIHAAYGKKIAPDDQENYNQARDILYKVTGWPPFLLQLTQEAGKLPELTDKITPYFTCEGGFQEFITFLKAR